MIPDSIVVAYVHNWVVDEEWARSLALAAGDPANKIIGVSSSANPRHESARNASIQAFLDETEGEWLMWIDTDQVFEPDAPARLRQTAKEEDVKMVGGITYVYKRDTGQMLTNGWSWNEDEQAFQDIHIRERGKRYRIDGTGSAFVLLHRKVFNYGRPIKSGTLDFGPKTWHKSWDEHYQTKKYMGHDLAFFYDTVVEGPFELVWDTSVESQHKKHFLLGWNEYARATANLWSDNEN